MTKKTLSASLLSLLAAGGLAACGSSKAPGVAQAPSSGLTEAQVTATATTSTTSTTSTPAVTTPKPPSPLSKKPVVTVPTGAPPKNLVVKDLITGTGAAAKSGSNVTVNYVGVLYKGGKEFDSSWKRNQTFPFTLGQGSVIKGWDRGLVGMKVGGRRELIIPPSLAYGATGSPPTIPANATLVFVVDLLGSS
ncbi:MAG TPA: FKBP-type peptidyl-prolyl cis-trans isomerase [Solirubrobacteraceae bacterium]|nr:FKBP-type peptidyl-prolyl cis-trans isomerase [Solirubrobacteraceae bacterium]